MERTEDKKKYSIGEVGKITGIPTSTLRFYEKEGLLPQVQRDKNG
ncbi:MAG: MerR family DNA-binding transcriptional regulator, partial [Fusobacteriaceae bacterium]